MDNVKPIQTRVFGCHFRSRLEARWAVFLTRLGLRWEYEPEGFIVAGTPYLPDFRIADWDLWLEVKPFDFTANTDDALIVTYRQFASDGRALLLVRGNPGQFYATDDEVFGQLFHCGTDHMITWAERPGGIICVYDMEPEKGDALPPFVESSMAAKCDTKSRRVISASLAATEERFESKRRSA